MARKVVFSALRDAGVEPSDAVQVGDVYEAEIVGAGNAGIKGVLLDGSGSSCGYCRPVLRTLPEVFPLSA